MARLFVDIYGWGTPEREKAEGTPIKRAHPVGGCPFMPDEVCADKEYGCWYLRTIKLLSKDLGIVECSHDET